MTTAVGKATNKNCAKPMPGDCGKDFVTTCDAIKFGGVPIKVAIPPIEAEKAIDNNNDFANGSIAFGSPVISSNLVTIANAFGTIVNAVAVFEIHMERNAVTMIMPKRSILGFNPKIKTVFRAILECKFHLTIATEKMNPPKNTSDVSENIDDAILDAVETPNNGSRNIGKKAVITIGIGSNIHQHAVIIVTPKHLEAFGFELSRTITSNKKKIAIITGRRNLVHQNTFFKVGLICFIFLNCNG